MLFLLARICRHFLLPYLNLLSLFFFLQFPAQLHHHRSAWHVVVPSFVQVALTLTQVILYYDYALTFVDEVDRFWNSGAISWGSFFFYLNRYLSLLDMFL